MGAREVPAASVSLLESGLSHVAACVTGRPSSCGRVSIAIAPSTGSGEGKGSEQMFQRLIRHITCKSTVVAQEKPRLVRTQQWLPVRALAYGTYAPRSKLGEWQKLLTL